MGHCTRYGVPLLQPLTGYIVYISWTFLKRQGFEKVFEIFYFFTRHSSSENSHKAISSLLYVPLGLQIFYMLLQHINPYSVQLSIWSRYHAYLRYKTALIYNRLFAICAFTYPRRCGLLGSLPFVKYICQISKKWHCVIKFYYNFSSKNKNNPRGWT